MKVILSGEVLGGSVVEWIEGQTQMTFSSGDERNLSLMYTLTPEDSTQAVFTVVVSL